MNVLDEFTARRLERRMPPSQHGTRATPDSGLTHELTAPPNPLTHSSARPSALPGLSPDLAAATLRSMSIREEPVHLYSIARELGVGSITIDDALDRPGLVQWTDNTPTIRVRASKSESRRRFALCHELAHVFLRHGGPGTDNISLTQRKFLADERMADATASALLVPAGAIDYLRNLDEIRLDDVRAVAAAHGTSFSVVVNRLRHAVPRPSILLELHRSPYMWETRRFVGGVKGLPETIDVMDDQYALLEQLPPRDVPLVVRVRMGNHVYDLAGDGNRKNSSVLLYINSVRFVAATGEYFARP